MFRTFFKFELGFWIRGMMLYIFLLIVGLLVFAAASNDNVQIGGALQNSHRNAPFVIQNYYAVMSLICSLFVTAFANAAAIRDFSYQTDQLVFTKPLKKFSYIMGRFWGSTLIAVIPMLGISVGIIVAGWMPWNDASQWGPISWRAHLWGILVFAVPNTIFISAIIFSIAIWTRSSIASFLGIIFLLIGYVTAQQMASNLDNETLVMLIDPLAINTYNLTTKYWTIADKNQLVVGLGGMMLLNRLIWLAVATAILGLGYWRFSFTEKSRRRRTRLTTPSIRTVGSIPRPLPQVSFEHNVTAHLAQLWSQIMLDFWGIVRSNVFIVVMIAGLLNTVVGLIMNASQGLGLRSLPVTYNMVDIIRGTMYLFLLAVITFYAGVLVWKEREAKLDEVYDALPHPTWIVYLGKLISLTAVVLIVLMVGMVCGIAVQAASGYTRYQIALYVKELLVLDFIQMFCLLVLALFSHVVSPNKYVGYFLFIVLVMANTFGWLLVDVETNMVKFGQLPNYVYSDFYGHRPFSSSLIWFSIYWLLFTIFMSIAAVLFWRRGCESGFVSRLAAGKLRMRGLMLGVGTMVLVFWFACGIWVYYNTKILNSYRTTEQNNVRQAEYETKFKKFANVIQPRITRVRYDIDIYPEKRALVLRGRQTIANKSSQPVSDLYLSVAENYETQIDVQGASLAEEYDDTNFLRYRFDPPLAAGAAAEMNYTVAYTAQGFENSVRVREIVQNGTFFNNGIAPQIGYQSGYELQDKDDRKRLGLPEPEIMPALDPKNLDARSNTYISNNSDWVDVETVISTSNDQIAVAPGSLLKKWSEHGRRYYYYKVDHPSLNIYSFISANYAVASSQWKGIDIEVYYHPDHVWNVDKMLRAIRSSLEYYTENFGPYELKQARIIEFPRVASFAQAFPGTMPYSEGIGFIADIKDEDDIDMVTYVVAHEMAHQWWAHQVIGANMLGSTVLSETLAQYSALMVMEREYGRDMMRKFLEYEMDNYLRSRGRELLEERPLVEVASNQGYVHYRKGSVVMYYLKEMIGENKVNAALRSLIKKFAYQRPPYPTSRDLVQALKQQTPEEMQYLLTDLFEDITLFANRTLNASYKELAAGKFEVTLNVECKKFKSDKDGNQTEVAIDDWIDIGAFAAPESGKRYGATLYRQRVKVSNTNQSFTFIVDSKPEKVGVDPFSLLIDRMPADNSKKPVLVN